MIDNNQIEFLKKALDQACSVGAVDFRYHYGTAGKLVCDQNYVTSEHDHGDFLGYDAKEYPELAQYLSDRIKDGPWDFTVVPLSTNLPEVKQCLTDYLAFLRQRQEYARHMADQYKVSLCATQAETFEYIADHFEEEFKDFLK